MINQDVIDYLNERAAPYGGTAADILDKTPSTLWDNPEEIRAFWEVHDLSHIFPQSDYPNLANNWNNIVAEEREVNRARGGEVMSHEEITEAGQRSQEIANEIDDINLGDDPGFSDGLIDGVFGG